MTIERDQTESQTESLQELYARRNAITRQLVRPPDHAAELIQQLLALATRIAEFPREPAEDAVPGN